MKMLSFASICLAALVTAHAAEAQTLTTLASFNGANGGAPYAVLLAGAAGNLYGTTSGGGPGDYGTVFKLARSGALTTLASFDAGANGGYLGGGLLADASGNLFGTTYTGGPGGKGTVFELSTGGALTTLATFNGANGANPNAGLIADASGNLFGTTSYGGAGGQGTVFELSTGGALTTLATFDGTNGAGANAGLIADASGNLYGTTNYGGPGGGGTVFEVAKGGALSTLVDFDGGANGGYSYGGLIADASGNLYGTTNGGGANSAGTVFKLSKGGALTTLANFDYDANGFAPFASLIADASGNLFGTTTSGGAGGYGTVFKLAKDGSLTTLASFDGGADGGAPIAGLIADGAGNLYGTTSYGGAGFGGTVFEITDSGFSVPEPAAWTLMLIGFGLVGGAARRRRLTLAA